MPHPSSVLHSARNSDHVDQHRRRRVATGIKKGPQVSQGSGQTPQSRLPVRPFLRRLVRSVIQRGVRGIPEKPSRNDESYQRPFTVGFLSCQTWGWRRRTSAVSNRTQERPRQRCHALWKSGRWSTDVEFRNRIKRPRSRHQSEPVWRRRRKDRSTARQITRPQPANQTSDCRLERTLTTKPQQRRVTWRHDRNLDHRRPIRWSSQVVGQANCDFQRPIPKGNSPAT